MKKIDMTGQKIGHLTVIGFSHKDSNGLKRWKCLCLCGNTAFHTTSYLRSGHAVSCGCEAEKWKHGAKTTHGMSKTRFHNIWKGMVERCTSHNHRLFIRYKDKGISERWKKFENFRDDMYSAYLEHCNLHGEKNTTIDRINNEDGYSLDNCRWATMEVQGNNRKTNKLLTFNNKTMTISQWARNIGVSKSVLGTKINKGWSIEKCLSTPIRRINIS